MLKTKTKKELQEIKDMGLYDDLCEISDLLKISYVSPYKGHICTVMMIYISVIRDHHKQRFIVIEYNGHQYVIIDTADYRYLYLF